MSNQNQNGNANRDNNTFLHEGELASINRAKLSPSTLKSIKSHLKTLSHNNLPLDRSLTINTAQKLKKMVDRKGKPLKSEYQRQIGMTIKRLFPDDIVDLSDYNGTGVKRRSKSRLASDQFVNALRNVCTQTSKVIQSVYVNERIDDLGLYDTSIAVLLTTCTSLRINELLQLTIHHIAKIQRSEPIGIKSKSSHTTRTIAPNNLLLSTFKAIELQRPYVLANINLKKLDHASEVQKSRFNKKLLLISSEDFMRKKLHELAANVGNVGEVTLGFNSFRKYLTSILVEGGGHYIAQAMNNHSSLNTTLDHYNIIASNSVEKSFTRLLEDMDGIITPKFPQQMPPTNVLRPRENDEAALIASNLITDAKTPAANVINSNLKASPIPVTINLNTPITMQNEILSEISDSSDQFVQDRDSFDNLTTVSFQNNTIINDGTDEMSENISETRQDQTHSLPIGGGGTVKRQDETLPSRHQMYKQKSSRSKYITKPSKPYAKYRSKSSKNTAVVPIFSDDDYSNQHYDELSLYPIDKGMSNKAAP